jgi:transcriptional regulator with XRE-family HTH domain
MTTALYPSRTRRLEGVLTLPRLRQVRDRRLLTIRALAERAQVSKTTVVRIEQGCTVRPETVLKLAAALDVEPADLMARERRA